MMEAMRDGCEAEAAGSDIGLKANGRMAPPQLPRVSMKIVIPYKPRKIFLPFHNRAERFVIIAAHRRAGKTMACVADLILRACKSKLPAHRAAYVAPFRGQSKESAWDYLKTLSRPVMGGNRPNESELYVKLFNGARIRVLGADNQDALRGAYLDNVVLDEFADMSPSLWGSIIRPMLADRQGTATFIGTPKGRNAFWQILNHAKETPNWYWSVLKASETGVLKQEELDAAKKDMDAAQYAAEFEVSFDAAIVGAYYGAELAHLQDRGHMLLELAPEPDVPVHTAWDLGIGDSTAIWCWQAAGTELRVLDFYENHGKALPHYVAELQSRGYNYGVDYVPHDAKVRELSTGRTRIETLRSLGRRPALVPAHTLADGINASRVTLQDCWFDATKCHDGIEALYQYRRAYDDKTRAFSNTPLHNFASHACLVAGELVLTERGRIPIERILVGDYVWTPCGASFVEAAGPVKITQDLVEIWGKKGRLITCTPEHKILTKRGFVMASQLTTTDSLLTGREWTCRLVSFVSRAANIGFRETITGGINGARLGRPTSTARFTRLIVDLSRMGMKSIISILIPLIAIRSTLFSLSAQSTQECIQSSELSQANFGRLPTLRWRKQLNGIDPKKAANGTLNMGVARGLIANGLKRIARNAASSIARLILRAPSSAMSVARIVRNTDAGGDRLVFDLTVKKSGCYSANGILVSNSDAFRGMAMAWREMIEVKRSEPPSLTRRPTIGEWIGGADLAVEKRTRL